MFKKILSIISAVLIFAGTVISAQASKTQLFADVDENGRIDASDARMVLRFSVDLDYYNRARLLLGDTDGNGKLTASDARNILRFSVGLDTPAKKTVEIRDSDYNEFINKPSETDIFDVTPPAAPKVSKEHDTFTFNVYGYGHGVGLSQYGSLTLDENGYKYNDILTHYYSGTEVKFIDEFPAFVIYPTYEYSEEAEKETWVQKERDTIELLVRMVYQEIYGVTKNGKYEEALKAMTICIFTNLAYFDFNVKSRWDVGVAYEGDYENIPSDLKSLVGEVIGQYITVKGKSDPIMAVYSGLAAGMTASAESVWGYPYSYLTAVPSHFDMNNPIFIKQYTYKSEDLKKLILSYDSSIVLSSDPAEWLEILEHTASMDENRGYVTKIRVGNKVLSGYNQFQFNLMGNKFISSCFTVDYTA